MVVAAWISEVESERLAAERELSATVPQEKLTKSQVRALVDGLGDVVEVLAQADRADKAAIYNELGITLTYHLGGRVLVEARPCTEERVGGGT